MGEVSIGYQALGIIMFGVIVYGVCFFVRSDQRVADEEAVLSMMKDGVPRNLTRMRDHLNGEIERHKLHAASQRLRLSGELLRIRGQYLITELGRDRITPKKAEPEAVTAHTA